MLHRAKTVWLALAVGIIVLIAVGRPILHLFRASHRDVSVIEKLPSGYADDISRMNKTQVAEIWDIPANSREAEERLRQLLQRAQASGLHVSIAGARHSM